MLCKACNSGVAREIPEKIGNFSTKNRKIPRNKIGKNKVFSNEKRKNSLFSSNKMGRGGEVK